MSGGGSFDDLDLVPCLDYVSLQFFKDLDLNSKTFLDFFYGAFGRFARLEGFVGGFCGAPVGVRSDRGRHTAAVAAGLESEGYGRQG